MKAISYIYAVLNDYISCDDFVNWTFEAIEEGQIDAFDSDMIVKIQNCNCENKGDIDNLKKMLAMRFESKLRNATPNCLTECTDLPLKLMLIYSSAANKLCVDFNDINTASKFHKYLRYAFHLPYWYGENMDAFADILDLSDYKIIALFNFTALKHKLPDTAEQLLRVIDINKNNDCVIICTQLSATIKNFRVEQ